MEDFCTMIYKLIRDHADDIEGNTYVELLDYGDIDLNYKGVHYRLKPMNMDEEV